MRLFSENMGVVEGKEDCVRTGDHRPEGLFVAMGPGIRKGHWDRVVSIMGFSPTFAEMLDVKLSDRDVVPIRKLME